MCGAIQSVKTFLYIASFFSSSLRDEGNFAKSFISSNTFLWGSLAFSHNSSCPTNKDDITSSCPV